MFKNVCFGTCRNSDSSFRNGNLVTSDMACLLSALFQPPIIPAQNISSFPGLADAQKQKDHDLQWQPEGVRIVVTEKQCHIVLSFLSCSTEKRIHNSSHKNKNFVRTFLPTNTVQIQIQLTQTRANMQVRNKNTRVGGWHTQSPPPRKPHVCPVAWGNQLSRGLEDPHWRGQFTSSHASSGNETFVSIIQHDSHLSTPWQEDDHQLQSLLQFPKQLWRRHSESRQFCALLVRWNFLDVGCSMEMSRNSDLPRPCYRSMPQPTLMSSILESPRLAFWKQRKESGKLRWYVSLSLRKRRDGPNIWQWEK